MARGIPEASKGMIAFVDAGFDGEIVMLWSRCEHLFEGVCIRGPVSMRGPGRSQRNRGSPNPSDASQGFTVVSDAQGLDADVRAAPPDSAEWTICRQLGRPGSVGKARKYMLDRGPPWSPLVRSRFATARVTRTHLYTTHVSSLQGRTRTGRPRETFRTQTRRWPRRSPSCDR